ncbi:MAG: DUF6624 domain-containing protein [Acidobacteriota bacterium]
MFAERVLSAAFLFFVLTLNPLTSQNRQLEDDSFGGLWIATTDEGPVALKLTKSHVHFLVGGRHLPALPILGIERERSEVRLSVCSIGRPLTVALDVGTPERLDLTFRADRQTLTNLLALGLEDMHLWRPLGLELSFFPSAASLPESDYTAEDVTRVTSDLLERDAGETKAIEEQRFEELGKRVKDNASFARHLLTRKGWLPADVFPRNVRRIAFIFVQHSFDLGLMEALLPALEDDDLEWYALLQDRVHLMRGREQEYGTQFWEQGLAPAPEQVEVDRNRERLGLKPMATLLERVGIPEFKVSDCKAP